MSPKALYFQGHSHSNEHNIPIHIHGLFVSPNIELRPNIPMKHGQAHLNSEEKSCFYGLISISVPVSLQLRALPFSAHFFPTCITSIPVIHCLNRQQAAFRTCRTQRVIFSLLQHFCSIKVDFADIYLILLKENLNCKSVALAQNSVISKRRNSTYQSVCHIVGLYSGRDNLGPWQKDHVSKSFGSTFSFDPSTKTSILQLLLVLCPHPWFQGWAETALQQTIGPYVSTNFKQRCRHIFNSIPLKSNSSSLFSLSHKFAPSVCIRAIHTSHVSPTQWRKHPSHSHWHKSRAAATLTLYVNLKLERDTRISHMITTFVDLCSSYFFAWLYFRSCSIRLNDSTKVMIFNFLPSSSLLRCLHRDGKYRLHWNL